MSTEDTFKVQNIFLFFFVLGPQIMERTTTFFLFFLIFGHANPTTIQLRTCKTNQTSPHNLLRHIASTHYKVISLNLYYDRLDHPKIIKRWHYANDHFLVFLHDIVGFTQYAVSGTVSIRAFSLPKAAFQTPLDDSGFKLRLWNPFCCKFSPRQIILDNVFRTEICRKMYITASDV